MRTSATMVTFTSATFYKKPISSRPYQEQFQHQIGIEELFVVSAFVFKEYVVRPKIRSIHVSAAKK